VKILILSQFYTNPVGTQMQIRDKWINFGIENVVDVKDVVPSSFART
jgi:hypothetical protein